MKFIPAFLITLLWNVIAVAISADVLHIWNGIIPNTLMGWVEFFIRAALSGILFYGLYFRPKEKAFNQK